MAGGRPSVVTDDVLRKLEESFLLGCTDEEACLSADIGTTALYEYQKKNPAFAERKLELKKNPVHKARKVMLDLMSSDDESVKMKAATDTLNRYDGKPKERMELTGENGGSIKTDNTFTVQFVGMDEVDKIEK